jgi:hypothetical protein
MTKQSKEHVDRAKVMKSCEEDLISVMHAQGLNPAECLAVSSIVLVRFVALATAGVDDDKAAMEAFKRYVADLDYQFGITRGQVMKSLPKSLRDLTGKAFLAGLHSTGSNLRQHHREVFELVKKIRAEAKDG